MKPFLYSVAEAYLQHEPAEIGHYCFVFPNKRSGVFFHHALSRAQKQLGVHTIHPASTTISDFVEGFVPWKKGERLELILILYQAYREVIYRHGGQTLNAKEIAEMVDFNRFQRWADMLISDFNDVDMFLVDPEQIFPNLERFREISANYVEPEVLEEIRRHWKMERLPEFSDTFWNHINHNSPGKSANEQTGNSNEELTGNSNEEQAGNFNEEQAENSNREEAGNAAQFFRLWQVMLELYTCFKEKLRQEGLYYPGMAYREALDKIRSMSADEFPYRRYIFVGFTMLMKAEEDIFLTLKDKPVDSLDDGGRPLADFYFDDVSPAFKIEGNTTNSFISRHKQLFKSLYDCILPITTFPKIEIVGVASRVGQTKLTGGVIKALYPEGGAWTENSLRRTAIVLPQESLVHGILSAIPEWISPINLTMGYRLRDSRAASLVKDIISLHLRARKAHGVVPTFYYEDVVRLLTHPLIRQIFPKQCDKMIFRINVERLYNIEATEIERECPELMEIFRFVDHPSDAMEVLDYFERLFKWLLNGWQFSADKKPVANEAKPSVEEEIDIDGRDISEKIPVKGAVMVDRMLARAYLAGITRLRVLADKYLRHKDLFLADTTVFQMLERLVGGETVNFEGRPLKGLQIMGVLESRSLDFENVILPSMNERIFPRKHYSSSFIPPHLRSAYGMSTQEHQESIYSYYFYRMISRARRVFLFYDARTQGVGAGQMSRYLNQLIHIYHPEGLKVKVLGYGVESRDEALPSVKKSPEIMREIERYRSQEDPLYLSASAINQYITCPLSFYLSYIAGYKREDDFHDYMDESTYGTIIHGIMEDLYKQEMKARGTGEIFDREVISRMMERKVEIEKAITRRINNHYNNLGEDCLAPLKGDAEIFGKIMEKYIRLLLQREIEAGPFEFIAGEYGDPMRLIIKGSTGRETINFRYSIDRIDRLRIPEKLPVLRVVDYKTGQDATYLGDIEDMFTERKPDAPRAKAVLQLFLYCQALAQSQKLDDPIQPWIYSIRKVATTRIEPIKISEEVPGKKTRAKVDIADYRDYVTEFNDRMLDVLSDLFNPEIPFEASSNPHACTFCKFTSICRRKSK